MATVKLTAYIEAEIESKVYRAYEPRVKAKREEYDKLLPTFEQVLDAFIVNNGGWELYEKVKDWLDTEYHVSFNRIGDCPLSTSIYQKDRKYVPTPENVGKQIVQGAAWAVELFSGVAAKFAELKQLNDECMATQKQVMEAFRAYPSVNAAVKAHPELEHMLPDHVKEKMAQKIERTRGPKADVHVDTSKIKQIATLNKLYANQGA